MATPSTQSLDGLQDEKNHQAAVPTAEQEISSQQLAASSNGDGDPRGDPQFSPDWRFFTAFIAIAVISLMAALDATSLSVALPIMARVLGGSAIEAFWSGTSFLLTSTVFQPIIGSFSHIFGRKPLVFVSLALFGAGAIVAAVANNFTVVLVGRTIQGIGGGGVIVLAEIILTDMVPLRERGKWLSAINGMWSIGTVVGPLLGGGFSQNVSWRWIFWINLPFIGIGAVMVALFLNLHYPVSSIWTKLKRVDWVGMTLFLASFTGFLIPITWGGVQYPWDNWRTLVPLIVSACGIVVFIIHQEKFASEPLIRTNVAKNMTAALTFFQTAIHGVLLWAILYYLPLYYEAVKGYGPILAGIALFPQTFTVAPAAIAVGITISVTGRYRWATWAGWFMITLGMGLLINLKSDSTVPQWIFLNLVSGLGAGFLFPSLAITVQACSSNADQAHATSMFSFMRALGQTFGVAIGGVVFQNQMRKKLLTYPLLADRAGEYSRDAAGLVQIIKALPPGEMKHQLRVSYTYSLKYVWIVMTALSALALVSTFFIKGYALDRALETEHGYKAKEKTPDAEGAQD